jgi:hypothetical protein
MPLLLVAIGNTDLATMWQLIAAYAAEYRREKWDDELRQHWHRIRNHLILRANLTFTQPKWLCTMGRAPKFHAIVHDDEVVQELGTFVHVDEMMFEGDHRFVKRRAKRLNFKLVPENVFLQKVRLKQHTLTCRPADRLANAGECRTDPATPFSKRRCCIRKHTSEATNKIRVCSAR